MPDGSSQGLAKLGMLWYTVEAGRTGTLSEVTMSHEVESMMYAKEEPWHGLGTYVGDHPILWEEAMVAAKLDWNVIKAPLTAQVGLDRVNIPGSMAAIRDSDLSVLGVVGDGYQVVQNREAFGFLDALAGDERLVRYHTAGSLFAGRRIWLLAELTDLAPIEPVPGDVVKPYVLLVNSHDGNMSLRAMQTSVRVVCNNTLTAALQQDGKAGVALRHSGDMAAKIADARQVLGLMRVSVERQRRDAEVLARKALSDAGWKAVLDAIAPIPETGRTGRAEATRERLNQLLATGPGSDIPGVAGTAWGALQAVTAWTTHVRTTTGAGQVAQGNRLAANWFGASVDTVDTARRVLLDA